MNIHPALIPEKLSAPSSRRQFLRRAGLASAVAAVAPAAAAIFTGTHDAKAVPATDMDEAVLNFALQTEYLGGSYYSYAATGQGLAANGAGVDGAGTNGTVLTKNNPKVPFSNPLLEQLCNELAVDEIGHVNFLRLALNNAGLTYYAMPDIDLINSYNSLSAASGLGPTFDPFANDVSFLIGGYVLDDTDVTAYVGASTLLTDPGFLAAAAGILAVEAYHAGTLRTNLFIRSQMFGLTDNFDIDIVDTVQAISNTKNTLSNGTTAPGGVAIPGATSSQGIVANNSANITAVDANSVAFARNTREILNILYGAVGATSGGFFPNGLNGLITS